LEAENFETKMSDSGYPMVALAVIPQPGTNYLDIAKQFYQEYDKLQHDLPPGFELNIAIDNTAFVKKAVLEVVETLLIAIVLVAIIIYVFLETGLLLSDL